MLGERSRKQHKGKVFVGLSGGVDSAVSAALLQREGYHVTGVFIRITVPGYPCTAGEDKIEAQRVAAYLRIPFIEIDLSKEYKEEVFSIALKEFEKGNTPNPDTLCNQKIKFGAFFNYAKSRGADFIATGHYTRIASQNLSAPGEMNGSPTPSQTGFASLTKANSGVVGALQRDGAKPEQISSKEFAYPETLLFAGVDPTKDQSYFLWMVPETVLRYTLFPVGNLQKSEVRALAKKFGLPNARRKDSQGLCFLGPVSLQDMLVRELNPMPGVVISERGEILGEHDGAALYTLGQRHGFRIHSLNTQTPAYFVIAKDTQKNTITVSTSPFPCGVSKTYLTLTDTNWIGTAKSGTYEARYRYRQELISSELHLSGTDAEVVLKEPHYPPLGQSLVLYEGERCLGGGIISRTELH